MKILISGSTGFVGSALVPFLEEHGHSVHRLVRHAPKPGRGDIQWDPEAGTIEKSALEGFDAVIHLSGENIGERWSAEKKRRIRDSRVKTTQLLAESLASLDQPPRVMISASAVGYYGNRGDEVLTEESPPGKMFLSEVCREWEAAAEAAAKAGIRVVNTRMAPVISPNGGVLAEILPLFKKGLGGKIGSGRQYMSWIAMEDMLRAELHILNTESLRGPVIVASPNPVTNEEFTRIMGRVLEKPTTLIAPAFALRLRFGAMADEVLLQSARLSPVKLMASGFEFRYPDLEETLRHLLRET